MVKEKDVIGVFRHGKSKSGLYSLLIHRLLATIQSKQMTFFTGFP